LTDLRVHNFARILVDYSTRVQPGDMVGIYTSTAAEPVVSELYGMILERGGYPHVLMDISDQKELLLAHASDEQLEFTPLHHKLAFEQFDVLIKVRSETNTRALTHIDPDRMARFQNGLSPLLATQIQRGAQGALRWVATSFPTRAYAMEADMGFEEYQDFFFRACYAGADVDDPLSCWQEIHRQQSRFIERIEGYERVELRGPDVDLALSVQGRKFVNGSGRTNLPDGEIYTGPVENSATGWVRFAYPAVYLGSVVEGVELTFEEGRVVDARAEKNQAFLLKMLEVDAGSRYLGEFAIGTNQWVDRFTRSILLDEKIGGSFHIALGAGYPETGSRNQSAIHWDLICDMRRDSEILVDGEAIYRDGRFLGVV